MGLESLNHNFLTGNLENLVIAAGRTRPQAMSVPTIAKSQSQRCPRVAWWMRTPSSRRS